MSTYCKDEYQLCFTSVVAEWLIKNVNVPSHYAVIFAHAALFVLTWYAVKFALRIFFNIIWPLLLVFCTLLVVRVIQDAGKDDLVPYLLEKIGNILNWMIRQSGKFTHIFSKTCPAGSKNCT